MHIQNDIITIEWKPLENDESFDAQFQRSMRLLTDGKLEEARFILEDLAFRSPDDPNVLYDQGICYNEFHELDIAIDTLNRCVILFLHTPMPMSRCEWLMVGRVN